MAKRDSLQQIRENQIQQQRMQKEAGDSGDSDENTETDIKTTPVNPENKPAPKLKTTVNTAAVLISDDKKNKKYTR